MFPLAGYRFQDSITLARRKRRLLAKRAEKGMARVGYALNDGESLQAVDGTGSFDQPGGGHHFHLARQVSAADFQKTVRLIVRSLQKPVDPLQIHMWWESPIEGSVMMIRIRR